VLRKQLDRGRHDLAAAALHQRRVGDLAFDCEIRRLGHVACLSPRCCPFHHRIALVSATINSAASSSSAFIHLGRLTACMPAPPSRLSAGHSPVPGRRRQKTVDTAAILNDHSFN